MRFAAWQPRARRGMKPKGGGALFVAPAMIFSGLFFVLPVVLTLAMSTYDYPLVGDPSFILGRNYQTAADDELLRQSLLFTAKYSVLVTAFTVVFGFGLACLVRSDGRFARLCRVIFFIPVVIGLPAASLLWLWLYNDQVGIFDALLITLGVIHQPAQWLASPGSAFLSIVVMTMWKTLGFSMTIFLLGLQAIPEDVQEAARLDGAGGWANLRWITLPLLKRTIAMVVLLTLTTSFLLFDQVYILTRGGPSNSTISAVYWIYSSAFVRFNLGYAAALSIVLLTLLLLVTGLQSVVFRTDST